MSLWRHSTPNFTEGYLFWKFLYITIKLVNYFLRGRICDIWIFVLSRICIIWLFRIMQNLWYLTCSYEPDVVFCIVRKIQISQILFRTKKENTTNSASYENQNKKNSTAYEKSKISQIMPNTGVIRKMMSVSS
jgi:hypothetical protein